MIIAKTDVLNAIFKRSGCLWESARYDRGDGGAHYGAPRSAPLRQSSAITHRAREEILHGQDVLKLSHPRAPNVIEKLDYTPGVFKVERHVRGKWACVKCQSLIQACVPGQVIDPHVHACMREGLVGEGEIPPGEPHV